MKKIYFLLLLVILSVAALAQKNGSVRGTIYDTLNKQPVAGATLTILQRKDSSLVTFSMTDNNGRFELKGIGNGDYRILITHVNFHNSNRYFSIKDDKKEVDLGNINLYDAAQVLPEAVVIAEAPPVTLIGDTIQYNAGSFKTQPNASVEDLLKKLPGVKVEKDGTIKAQGEKVNKVLVDGKEFFGNDPKVATKNLPADAIDKVQVYDKQSDQSQLTGFDDGNSEKTINLKLKKDKKKGAFGKIMAGGGTNDRYESRFNVNSFKGARQLSVIGMANNDNAEGFSVFDMLNFSGELNRLRQGGNGGNVNITINSSDPSMGGLGGNSNGINTTRGGGVNYNNILGKKTDFQSNYFYSRFNPNNETHSQRQYFLPDSTYYTNENLFSDNITSSHRVNLIADIILDSLHSIKISPSFGYQEQNNSSYRDYENFSDLRQRSVQGYSRNLSENTGLNFRNDLLFRKKFRRKGRTISFSLQNSFNKSEGDGSLESVNKFFDPATGTLLRSDSINQRYDIAGRLNGYTGRVVYTEPIFKRSLLELSASKSSTHSLAEKETFDYNKSSGKYDVINKQLSNDFENIYGYTQGGIRFRNQKKKFNYAIGLSWQQAELEGKIIADTKDSVITKKFNNLLPNARIQYNFTRYKNLIVNYSTNTNQPTASQLQPVPDNSNPLNIRVGNPDLQQEFSHIVRLQFMSVNPFKNKNFFMFLNLMKTDNKIVNNDVISNNIKTSKPVNVDGVYNFSGNVSYGFPIRAIKATLNISNNAAFFRNKQIVNGKENASNTFTTGPDVRIDMSLGDKANLSLGAGLNYNSTNYSLPTGRDTRYMSQQYSTDFDWELPKGFFFATDFVYTVNNQLTDGFNAKVPFLNASISKQFLRFNRGELKLKAYDLLNQNLGVSRNANQYYIEDIRVRNLRRYFLLSFTFSLSKTGLAQGASGNNMRVISR